MGREVNIVLKGYAVDPDHDGGSPWSYQYLEYSIIAVLWDNPEIINNSGRAVQDLEVLLDKYGFYYVSSSLKKVLKDLEDKGTISRDIRGRKTYSIILKDASPYAEIIVDLLGKSAPPELIPPRFDVVIEYDKLAEALLNKFLEGLSEEELQRLARENTVEKNVVNRRESGIDGKYP